jgi:hypothetical protein
MLSDICLDIAYLNSHWHTHLLIHSVFVVRGCIRMPGVVVLVLHGGRAAILPHPKHRHTLGYVIHDVEFHERIPWILVGILLGSLTIVRAGDVFFAWESLFDELHHCTGQRMQLLQVLVCHCDSPRLSGPRQECFQTFDNAQGRVCAVEHLVFRLHLCEHSSHRKRQHHKHRFSLLALQLPVVCVPPVPNAFHLAEDSHECIFFPLCQSSCITNNSQLPVYDSPYTAPHRGVHAPKSVLAQLVVYPPDDSAHQVLVQPCTVSSSQFIARVRAQTLSCVHAYTTRTQRLSPSSTCIGSGVVC